MAAFSVVYGSLAAGLANIYLKTCEKIQYWCEKYSPPKKWTRRSLHIIMFMLALVIIISEFLFWFIIFADFIKGLGLSEYPTLKLLGLVLSTTLFCFPFFFFRRHIFSEMDVKKLWE
jgi:hypothetical protein